MRLFVALIILVLSACAPTVKPLPVTVERVELGGVMVGATVLSGDYLLVTDLLIPEGSRLEIRPGTTIQVRRAELTKIDPEFLSSMTELLVRGALVIQGTVDAPVLIAPEKTASANDPAWAGLLLDNVRSSSIRHTQISGADTGLLLIAADIDLMDSRLEKNRYGLVIQGGSPSIERNIITAGEGGLFIWNAATPVLNGNIVSQNEEEGVYIDRSSHPKSSNNRSEHNSIGIVSSEDPDLIGFRLVKNGESWRQLQKIQGAK